MKQGLLQLQSPKRLLPVTALLLVLQILLFELLRIIIRAHWFVIIFYQLGLFGWSFSKSYGIIRSYKDDWVSKESLKNWDVSLLPVNLISFRTRYIKDLYSKSFPRRLWTGQRLNAKNEDVHFMLFLLVVSLWLSWKHCWKSMSCFVVFSDPVCVLGFNSIFFWSWNSLSLIFIYSEEASLTVGSPASMRHRINPAIGFEHLGNFVRFFGLFYWLF